MKRQGIAGLLDMALSAASRKARRPRPKTVLVGTLPFLVGLLCLYLFSGRANFSEVVEEVEHVAHEANRVDFSKFRDGQWVTGVGMVIRVLDDDVDPPRHQRFILEDEFGNTVLVAHNIDLAVRLQGLRAGDEVAFHGEYKANDRGGVVHWTHPDPQQRRQGGWLRKR